MLAPIGSENPDLDSERLEAAAIAMAPVPKHLLDSVEALQDDYFSVRDECGCAGLAAAADDSAAGMAGGGKSALTWRSWP